jgi:hypothetical protein
MCRHIILTMCWPIFAITASWCMLCEETADTQQESTVYKIRYFFHIGGFFPPPFPFHTN